MMTEIPFKFDSSLDNIVQFYKKELKKYKTKSKVIMSYSNLFLSSVVANIFPKSLVKESFKFI